MNAGIRSIVLFFIGLLVPAVVVFSWLKGAEHELKNAKESAAKVAIASNSEDSYCTPALKQILRRVAGACGLIGAGGGRGCKPADAKNVAALSGDDFNALFIPMLENKRAGIIQFDPEVGELDVPGQDLVKQVWADQRGASFFFVVSRASPDGSKELNQQLSQQRAESVLTHLERTFNDPDLKNEVGLLWLGEEYAQFPDAACQWKRSRTEECTSKEINRSAFVTWIDCTI
ncbi:MAG: hypothetical protein HY791_22625 [Deltaproteobacteria bacterium]|nr:hypothetical protein [Deltaproteobacteria bacterium]